MNGMAPASGPPQARLRLRVVLAVAFTVIGLTPAVLLSVWLHAQALDAQVADAKGRSMLMANTLSRFLDLYLTDVRDAVHRITGTDPAVPRKSADAARLKGLGLTEVCRLSDLRRAQDRQRLGDGASCLPTATEELWADLDARRPATGTAILFSRVLKGENDQPTVFVARYEEGVPRAIAAVSLRQIKALRESIVFGEQGHVAVVDHLGNVVAHPRPDWEAATKNISDLEPVKRMIAGERGTSRFFSSAADVYMLAGYAAIPAAGWGIMVPQPERELYFHAERVRTGALFMLSIGVFFGALLAWWYAGRLTLPIAQVERASARLAAGETGARVDEAAISGPAEVQSLTRNFNSMAAQLEERAAENARMLNDLRSAHGVVEQRIAERTLELTMEINERDRAEKELLRSKAEVEYANRAKTEFLAHMSHELRTPLNAIIGFAEVLRDTDEDKLIDGQMHKYATYIHESGEHLLKLINDLLDVSRIEAGAITLEIKDVDVNEVIDACMPIVTDRAARAGVELSVDVAQGIGRLWADQTRLRQILLNLVVNAVKFTPEGGKVSVRARPAPDGGVELVVADTGIGIPVEEIDRVMKPFSQARQSSVSNNEGTGLGLPLAHSFTVLHGGSLKLESAPGQGTTATVLIPFRPPGRGEADSILI